jgi:hypothetical protein
MDKFKVDSKCTCSNCGKEVETGYVVFTPKGNKFICIDCDTKGTLNKKISITVMEFKGTLYGICLLFGSPRMYKIISQTNICLHSIISEQILLTYINQSNIDVKIK